MKYEDCLKYYSKTGKVIKWYTENSPDSNGAYNYGFIRDGSNEESVFAHISKYGGTKKVDESFIDKKCVFNVGYEPKKPTKLATLSFLLEDDLEKKIVDFNAERKTIFSELDFKQLLKTLKNERYLKLWESSAPTYKLKPDIYLFEEIQSRLSKELFSHKEQKLLFEELQNSVYEFPKSLLKLYDDYLFRNEIGRALKDGLYEYSKQSEWFNNLIDESKIKFINDWLDEVTLGFDIEANEENLFQCGFYGKLLTAQTDGTFKDNFNRLSKNHYWLIGHNIIGWDLPRIKKDDPNIPFSNIVWDTLFVSFLLDPRKKTHALTTSANAHEAVEDAKATLDLFYLQLSSFDRRLLIQYDNKHLNSVERIKLLSDYLLDLPSVASSPPIWLKEEHKTYIIPDFLMEEVQWVPDILFDWPEGYSCIDDMFIDIQKLEKVIAKNHNDIYLTILKEMIKQVSQNNIPVLVRMLPLWIRENIDDHLKSIINNKISYPSKFIVVSYKSLRESLSPKGIQAFLLNKDVICIEEGFEELLPDPVFLDKQRVTDLKKNISNSDKLKLLNHYPTSGIMVRIDDLPVKTDSLLMTRWLEFVPAFRSEIKKTPFCLFKNYNYKCTKKSILSIKNKFIIPRWIEDSNIRSDQVFLAPTSGNRRHYWEDLLFRLMSIIDQETNENVQYVFLVEFYSELVLIKNILCNLNLTISSNKNSLLRQVEETFIKKSKKVFIGTIRDAKNVLNACIEFNLNCRFIIETAPIHKWQIYYENNSEIIDQQDPIDNEDEIEDLYENDEDEEENKEYSLSKNLSLDLNSWGEFLEKKLNCWYVELFSLSKVQIEPIILDSRLSQDFISKNSSLVFKNFIYSGFSNEIAKEFDQNTNNFSDIERLDPPINYEEYKKFLSDNWNYDDFKETQKEPVKAIIPNNKDVIVRLPTGEGKSVIFQIPSLLRSFYTQRLSIVISPLRALMTDQVERLWKEGFVLDVDYLSGDREFWENNEVYQHIVDGQLKLLYVAPERFRVKKFREAIYRRFQADGGFEYIIVDEAHCISQWGFEFRPDYLFCISEIIKDFRQSTVNKNSSFIFLSATITDAILNDIVSIANLKEQGRKYQLLPKDIPHPIRDFIKVSSEPAVSGLYDDNGLIGRLDFIENIVKKVNPKQSSLLIFCTRKKHTEEIEEKLTSRNITVNGTNVVIRSFHAGLPVDERLDVYEELKDGKVHVLAATKAFGMGMDISNIHWCVHLAPPNYLEDYLQEVGRTGRDEYKRKVAGLSDINCELIYHPNDFERTRMLIQRNKIEPQNLSDLFKRILSNSKSIPDSQEAISIISDKGDSTLKIDQFTKTIYWLEKSGRIEILGKLPNILRVKVDLKLLENAALANNDEGKIAKSISNVIKSPQSVSPSNSGTNEGVIKKAFNLLAKTIGFFFGNPIKETRQDTIQTANNSSENLELDINLAALYQEAELKYIDDAFRLLGNLQEKNCLEINREIKFKKGRYVEVSEILFKWLNNLIDNFLISTKGLQKEITEENFASVLFSDSIYNNIWNNKTDQFKRIGQRRSIRALLRLFTASQIKVRKQLNLENQPVYVFSISDNQIFYAKNKIDKYIRITKKLFELLESNSNQDATFKLGVILKALSNFSDYKINDIQIALKILSSLGFYTAQSELLPWSYILHVKNQIPFPTDINEPDISPVDKECIDLIKRTNKLAELRSYAFEIFSLVPSELRKKFIDEYFKISDVGELESFIVNQSSGLILNDNRLEFQLQEIASRVRQEAFIKEFELLDDVQKDICELHFSNNIIVNAGPGAGKTRVLIMRAAHMIHKKGLQPNEILILAFNRAVVYEIKSRLTELFRQLGYGNYASRIQVYTFHSFAMKYFFQKDNGLELEKVLHLFTEQTLKDEELARNVTSGIRSIMVDEFQDMNEDFYNLIIRLKEISEAGIMVIGDDDQDILLWNRLNWKTLYGDTKLHSNEYFESFKKSFPGGIISKELRLNYRSSRSIVEKSQIFLNEKLIKQVRIKSQLELLPHNISEGLVHEAGSSDFDATIKSIWETKENKKTIAILCRTNLDCFSVAQKIDVLGYPYNVLGDSDYPLYWIRNIGHWVDCCQSYIESGYNTIPLLTDFLYKEVFENYAQLKIPLDLDIRLLWDFTLRENPRANLIDHINFLKETKKSDLLRILRNINTNQIMISTINKVKGLEFDIVYLKSSQSSFPFGKNHKIKLEDFTLEEFRLWYVGMTRAKEKLFYEWGARENEWFRSNPFSIVNDNTFIILSGSPEEVEISYAAKEENDAQLYIENNLIIDDEIDRSFGMLFHKNNKIGAVSTRMWNKIKPFTNSSLKVSEVLRYPITTNSKGFKVAQKYVDQEWYYTVLFKGKIW